MTESAEEAVIGKEARIKEEVVVRKTADERVEQINETVRHSEVEVDEDAEMDAKVASGKRQPRRDEQPGRPRH